MITKINVKDMFKVKIISCNYRCKRKVGMGVMAIKNLTGLKTCQVDFFAASRKFGIPDVYQWIPAKILLE